MSGNLHNKKQKALSLFSAKEYEQAIRILKKIIDTTPYDADCWHLLSTIYGTISNFAKADQCASRAISIQPNRAVAYLNKGNALMGLDRSGEAQNCYLKCSTLQPNNPDAFFNLALCYKSQGSLKQAEECYRRVIDLAPQRADAYNNLGNILQEKRLFDEALEAYDNAINLTPNLLEALFNKAATYLLLGRTEPAIRGFKKVLEKDPNHLQAYSRLLFAQNYSASVSPQKHYHDHTDWGDKLTKLIEPSTAYSNNINPEKVLHVGYVSPDFRNSVAVYTIELLLRHHDANKVKVYCYSYTRKPDELTEFLRTLAPAWRDISELDDMHAYQIIRNDYIDILVDLNGHTPPCHRLGIFAMRAAPVQVTYLGYPNTTGLREIDYRLTDIVADPPGEKNAHTEELYRLDRTFASFKPPENAPDVTLPPCTYRNHITLGSLNNPTKLNDSVIALWARLLHTIPNTKLLVFRNVLKGPAKKILKDAFSMHGISYDRVEVRSSLTPGAGHLSLYGEIDIALDPFPWNGHVTTLEALWMGVPVVALYGDRHASRMCASALNAASLNHLIATNEDEYIQIVKDLCTDKNNLNEIRTQLRGQVAGSALCDGKSLAREIETAYRVIWKRWCDDQLNS